MYVKYVCILSGVYLHLIKIYASDGLFDWNSKRTKLLEPFLKHPLSMCFLHLKWQQTKWFHYFFLLCHIIFCVTYSGFVIFTYTEICDQLKSKDDMIKLPSLTDRLNFTITCTFDHTWQKGIAISLWVCLILFNILYMAKEVMRIRILGKK